MKISFSKLEIEGRKISYTLNNGESFKSVSVRKALQEGIHIDREECSKLSEIYLKTFQIDNIRPSFTEEIENQFNREIDTRINEYRTRYVDYKNIDMFLQNNEHGNSIEDVIVLYIINFNGNLKELNDKILFHKKYVDLRPSILTHSYDDDFVQELINEEYDEFTYVTGNEYKTSDIKAFPNYFAGNEYLIGISIPKEDNYSMGNVFKGCKNLKYIDFDGNKLFKATLLDSGEKSIEEKYFIYKGQKNFKLKNNPWITILDNEKEFVDILTKDDKIISQLMWYDEFWPDCEDNPGLNEDNSEISISYNDNKNSIEGKIEI